MFMFSGYFYSFDNLHKLSPIASYLNLINPVIYAVEGVRTAVLGQNGNIPFYIAFLLSGVHSFFCFS